MIWPRFRHSSIFAYFLHRMCGRVENMTDPMSDAAPLRTVELLQRFARHSNAD